MPLLTRVVGWKKAHEIWMLCRRYTAQEALEMGLVNKLVPLDQLEEEVDKWCEEILALSPSCLTILKAAFDCELDMLPPLCRQAGSLYPDFFDSEECQEGPAAFTEKRKPNFWKIRKAQLAAREGK